MTSLIRNFMMIIVFLLTVMKAVAVAATVSSKDVYIVYMGAAKNNDNAAVLLTRLRNEGTLLENFGKSFSGFAARMSEEEAERMAGTRGVVSVFREPTYRLLTTHSWDFLWSQTRRRSMPEASPPPRAVDTIIGFLDSGIWPESASFDDTGMGPIPPQWKGKCMEARDFNSSLCNRKLIGARYYPRLVVSDSPRDKVGHGTHVASTAAGSRVPGASYYGLASGVARGGSPGSRIAMYQVCDTGGDCPGSAVLKAFDDAIADGCHVLSISLGYKGPPLDKDPFAIGAFHAVEKGIPVIFAAGNSGPTPMTVLNAAPWILTVGATTTDRFLEVPVVLGGNKVIKGGGISFSNLSKTPVYPLVVAKSNETHDDGENDARYYYSGSSDVSMLRGKIVLYDEDYYPISKTTGMLNNLNDDLGIVGTIMTSDEEKQDPPPDFGTSAVAVVSKQDAAEIKSYVKSTSNPVATILPTVTVYNYKPAPVVAYFSSRGPIHGIKNLIKPDVTAPGIAILAAWPLKDKESPLFNILSGTSMSCPHVSGLAANVKSEHPTWSPSAIKSAIMTTANHKDKANKPITTLDGSIATPYDIGSGEIMVLEPLEPGLVYETTMTDYLNFLCGVGYSEEKIGMIASVPKNFSCPSTSGPDAISNMNYPTIAISNLKPGKRKEVVRTVSNVGEEDSVYTVAIEKPNNIDVQVVPNTLKFRRGVERLSFKVIFTAKEASKIDVFGSITWSYNKYRVRSPFVVGV